MKLRPLTHLPAYLLTTNEVARWLRIKASTIRKWTCYNRIPYIKIGRKVGFRPADIEAWLELKNPQMKKWQRKFRRGGRVA